MIKKKKFWKLESTFNFVEDKVTYKFKIFIEIYQILIKTVISKTFILP